MQQLPLIYLVRHGETAWALSGQHTGLSDIPLTERGQRDAQRIAERLRGLSFTSVLTSPSQRARRTCELAGFGAAAKLDPDLVEWNYGKYEGITSAEIRKDRPDWDLFRDGCPDGESVADIGHRADRVVARLRALEGVALVFSSGHILRVVAARWCNADTSFGQRLLLGTGSVSILGYDHNKSEPVIKLWNDRHHHDGAEGQAGA